ncbi:uncharacterized protein LOC126660074 [Mercurialis annua]|uniref:uncharacterized protein LOC126660074 n=1 Tax=Mercurialis annua TaxID=3986 RepID=UPI0021608A02|nr:uncharacterized protein LOC126660074 [Mercurialis annua]
MVVGIVGIEGMLGNGGKLNLGRVGMVGIGRGGSVVGNVGSVGIGRFGILGKDGNALGFGKFGNEGKFGICRRLRAASPTSMPENAKAMKKKKAIFLNEGMLYF